MMIALNEIEPHLVDQGEPTQQPPSPSPRTTTPMEARGRATLYAAKWSAAVEGRRSNEAFHHAATLLKDFDLADGDAWEILRDWNATNTPPLEEEELQKILDNAGTYGKHATGRKLNAPRTTRSTPSSRVRDEHRDDLPVRRLDTVEAEDVVWFWDNVFADYALNLLVGDPGSGKSYLTQGLSACITTGTSPVGLPTIKITSGSVGLFSCEDSAGIIRTRIEKNGGNAQQIYVVSEPVNIATQTGLIDRFLSAHPDCRALIFDPITSYLGDINTNATGEVRAALTPLLDMIADRHVMVLAVNHMNKRQDLSPIYRSAGAAGGLVALARSVWGVAVDRDDPETRIFYPLKSNYAIKPTGLKFRIIDGVVTYDGAPWNGSIDDHLRPAKSDSGSPRRVDECAEWLRERLRAGATQSNTIISEAEGYGFNRDLCFRAKDRLKVKVSKSGFGKNGTWFWQLSDDEESKNA